MSNWQEAVALKPVKKRKNRRMTPEEVEMHRVKEVDRVAGPRAAVGERRCKFMGWKTDAGSVRRALNPLLGHSLGQLCYTRKIGSVSFDGLIRYMETHDHYTKAIGMPRLFVAAQCLYQSDSDGPTVILDDDGIREKARKATSAYMSAEGVLQASKSIKRDEQARIEVAGADLSIVLRVLRDEIDVDTFDDLIKVVGDHGLHSLKRSGMDLAEHFGMLPRNIRESA